MNDQFTFQVNISPGDILYAEITVRELAKLHLNIPDRLLIVDCCKPQKTKLVNPLTKFPEPQFSSKIAAICEIANQLLAEKLFTRVYFLKPEDDLIKIISKKYLNDIIKSTHGAGGTAQMAYWAGIELSKTRYLIHYDGDMILYQESGFEWWIEAATKMQFENDAIIAIPRHCPPTILTGNLPTYFEGTEIFSKSDYWLHNWFSTRVFLIDTNKLQKYLPLINGKIFIELLFRKILFRAFPLDPEIILFRQLGIKNAQRRLILKSNKAWTLHPHTKPSNYLALLPKLYAKINNNCVPDEQLGKEDIELNAWIKFCND